MNKKKIKVACISPRLFVGNVTKNCDEIIRIVNSLSDVDVAVFPELCLCGATCGDLLFHDVLINACEKAVERIRKASEDIHTHIIFGSPVKDNDELYNCACHIHKGNIISVTSKKVLDGNEARWFNVGYSYGNEEDFNIVIGNDIYCDTAVSPLTIRISAEPTLVKSYDYLISYAKEYTEKKECALVCASAGVGESTTDFVYSGACYMAQDGKILCEGIRFSFDSQIAQCEIEQHSPALSEFSVKLKTEHTDEADCHPFIPSHKAELKKRCEEIINIQTSGLAKRMLHTNTKKLVLGISGGLDSTLALLIAVKTMEKLNLPVSDVFCLTLPGFGTTDLTYTNACNLVKSLGATLKEVNIKDACLLHFKDIDHDPAIHDVTYENTQARERTQILMDYANKKYALLVGTGDLSELALGWCTYNGDHMSMYGVNASIPKTLMQHLVRFIADSSPENVAETLYSVLDTPISPELLPPDKNGKMEQKTEDTLGPYEVHDYFIYHFIRHRRTTADLLKMSVKAFDGIYTEIELRKWLEIFVKRFFNSQFKRSCIPDGPATGTVSLSPRGSFIMPSDMCYDEWLKF